MTDRELELRQVISRILSTGQEVWCAEFVAIWRMYGRYCPQTNGAATHIMRTALRAMTEEGLLEARDEEAPMERGSRYARRYYRAKGVA